jgi:dethiobiotin synthetase
MSRQIFFVTGTDTGVGKTVVATLLTRHLRQRGLNAIGLKPVSSGGREDALILWRASDKSLSLDEINPWHFREPLSPLLAARRERRRVQLTAVVARVRAIQKKFEAVVVEGAGGLLSPLGENFDSRDLLLALRAKPIVVCPNRLGAVNQALLVWEALPPPFRRRARLVLMNPPRPDAAARSNRSLLGEFIPPDCFFLLPHLPDVSSPTRRVAKKLGSLLAA